MNNDLIFTHHLLLKIKNYLDILIIKIIFTLQNLSK